MHCGISKMLKPQKQVWYSFAWPGFRKLEYEKHDNETLCVMCTVRDPRDVHYNTMRKVQYASLYFLAWADA